MNSYPHNYFLTGKVLLKFTKEHKFQQIFIRMMLCGKCYKLTELNYWRLLHSWSHCVVSCTQWKRNSALFFVPSF